MCLGTCPYSNSAPKPPANIVCLLRKGALWWSFWVFSLSFFSFIFIWGSAGLTLLHGPLSSFGAGFSLWRLLLLWARARGLGGSRLQSTDSVAVTHRSSGSVACGIFPDQRSNPRLLHWQADSYPLSHWGSLMINFLSVFFCGLLNLDLQKSSCYKVTKPGI